MSVDVISGSVSVSATSPTSTSPTSASGGSGSGRETEGLIGFAERFNKNMKIEEGIIYRNDHTWQFVSAFEWSFSGEN